MWEFFCFFAFFTYMKEDSDESSGENLHDSKTFKGHNQKWRPSHSEYQFAKEHNRDPKWRQWAHPSPTQAAWASESQTQGCREDPCPEPWRPASQGIKERTKGEGETSQICTSHWTTGTNMGKGRHSTQTRSWKCSFYKFIQSSF